MKTNKNHLGPADLDSYKRSILIGGRCLCLPGFMSMVVGFLNQLYRGEIKQDDNIRIRTHRAVVYETKSVPI